MGVPAFFKWLIDSCPQCIHKADISENSCKARIDNLYLDLNGIIHPCTHPQGVTEVPVPTSELEMWHNIRRYLDLVIGTVSPKKLIYFAIDGVAPRAKMKQQRGRRFKAAKEIQQNKIKKQTMIKELVQMGMEVD